MSTTHRTLRRLLTVLLVGGGLTAGAGGAARADDPPSSLRAGQTLVVSGSSAPGAITEVDSPDGHFVLSLGAAGGTAYLDLAQRESLVFPLAWRVQRDGVSAGDRTTLALQSDGNLVLYAQPGRPVWSTGTAGTGSGNHLDVQADGNLVLRTRENRTVWSSGSHTVALYEGRTLGPGEYLKSNPAPGVAPTTVLMQPDGDLVIREGDVIVWASNTTTPGASATMQTDGNLVISAGGRALWASGTAGITGGRDGGDAYLEAYHRVRGDARISLTPPRVGAGGFTYPWNSEQRAGEFGLLGAQPARRVLVSPISQDGVMGSVLRPGQYLGSSNGYHLAIQTDGNLVERDPAGRAVWASGTPGHPGAYFTVQQDGNLVVHAGGRAIWSAGTTAQGPSTLTANVTCQTDGNVVARSLTGAVVWSTGPARR